MYSVQPGFLLYFFLLTAHATTALSTISSSNFPSLYLLTYSVSLVHMSEGNLMQYGYMKWYGNPNPPGGKITNESSLSLTRVVSVTLPISQSMYNASGLRDIGKITDNIKVTQKAAPRYILTVKYAYAITWLALFYFVFFFRFLNRFRLALGLLCKNPRWYIAPIPLKIE